jgi:hypothetical protein
MGEFVLLGLRAETKFINVIDDFPEIVTGRNFFDLAENLPNFVFDCVGPVALVVDFWR